MSKQHKCTGVNCSAISPAVVAAELDLIDVGARIAADDKASVQDWMKAELLHRVSDAQAMQWLAQDALLWTVVVKPWILVQHERRVPADAAH